MTLCPEVLEQLGSDDAEVLREAAYKAGEAGCESAVPRLAELLTSRNLGVQEAAEAALRQIGGSVTVQSMVPLLHSEDVPVRNLAMDILRQIGNQDFRSLVDILHDDDPDIRIFATDILGSTANVLAVGPLCESLLKDPEVNVRYQAAVSLGELAMPEAARCLNKALGDEEWVQFAVIEALSKIKDDSSVDALVKALDTATDLIASMIVEALGEMGNIKAATMLLRRLDESSSALRNKIVRSIVNILGGKSLALLSETERGKLCEYLIAALHDEDGDIQDAAILGLGYVGGVEASAEVLDLAARMNFDSEPERVEQAVATLSRIGLNDALVFALSGDDLQRALIAVESMARIGNGEVSRILREVFWSTERDLQREIVQALLRVAGEEAGPFFLDVLTRHEDGTVLKGAMKFLGSTLRMAEAGETIFGFIDHPYNDVKEAALEACIALDGEEMAERFGRLFNDPDPIHRLMAAYVIGKTGRRNHLDKLRGALEDEIPDIRKVAVEAIAEVCGFEEECRPSIVSRLSDENSDVRLAVVELLGRFEGPEAAEQLLRALEDDNDWVRIRAMEALAARRERAAIARLVPLLQSDNKLVVLKVVECLGEIGGQAAFRALLDVSSEGDPEVMDAAAESVAKIQSLGEDL
ncbi:PBS lyase HEAT domain protein repeat-containing protein [Desulfovibrio sp. X2]|uniref:HEAT repeat domain-containing protein n=1 Tax=Desulfovibrio sp. X2 TaxID=941449 RepID=UPI0003587B42|nr:HEAT repeat domain-containing protein [Desulfovibrio sp. X2]EPR37308.1 PBS lyase HEAT domain protein repeat-containing protein [Desulfovibrio sp. X2]